MVLSCGYWKNTTKLSYFVLPRRPKRKIKRFYAVTIGSAQVHIPPVLLIASLARLTQCDSIINPMNAVGLTIGVESPNIELSVPDGNNNKN